MTLISNHKWNLEISLNFSGLLRIYELYTSNSLTPKHSSSKKKIHSMVLFWKITKTCLFEIFFHLLVWSVWTMKKSWATSKKEWNFFHTKFQVEESEVIVAGGYLEVGGTILRDTDKYTLNGNGRISKQESGFLQKPRKYHRLAHRLTLFSICNP